MARFGDSTSGVWPVGISLIDGLRVHISRVLRGLNRREGFRKIAGHDAARDGALQCADMIAGALADHISGGDSWAYEQVAEKFATILRRPETKSLPG